MEVTLYDVSFNVFRTLTLEVHNLPRLIVHKDGDVARYFLRAVNAYFELSDLYVIKERTSHERSDV